MDDEDSKIRRNLVLVSALIIGAHWLQLDLVQAARGWLHFKEALDLPRFWMAELVVLGYLALRYRDADLKDGKSYRTLADEDRSLVVYEVITRYVNVLTRLYLWLGVNPRIISPSFSELERIHFPDLSAPKISGRANIRAWAVKSPPREDAVTKEKLPAIYYLRETRNFSVSMFASNGKASHGGQGFALRSSAGHTLILGIWTTLWCYFYSPSAVRARFPVLMGLAATVLVFIKIVMHPYP